MKNCINCNAEIQDESRFCAHCGASQPEIQVEAEPLPQSDLTPEPPITQDTQFVTDTQLVTDAQLVSNPQLVSETQFVTQQDNQKTIPEKKKKKWLIPLIASVLAITLISGSVFGYLYFFNKKYAFYVKDNQITQMNLVRKEAISISDDIYKSDESYSADFFNTYMTDDQLFQVRNEGQLIFYPEKVTDDGKCDYFVYNTKTKKSEEIDSKILYEYGIQVDAEGKNVVYVAGSNNTLYKSDLSKETKIAENVNGYHLNDETGDILYVDTEGRLYYVSGTNDPLLLCEMMNSIVYSEDLKHIYFTDEGKLYYSNQGKEPQLIAENINGEIWGSADKGVYYQKENVKEISYRSMVEDSYKSSDALLVEPNIEDFETEEVTTYWFGTYTNTVTDWDAYYDAYYAYEDKVDRDFVRESIASGSAQVYLNTLYFYADGTESVVAEGVNYVYDYSAYLPVVIYEKMNYLETNKIKIEDLAYLAYYGADDIRAELDDEVYYNTSYDENIYCAYNGKENDITSEMENISNYMLIDTPKGSKLYMVSQDDNYEYSDIYAFDLENMSLEKVAEETVNYVFSPKDDTLYYFKDGDYSVADLYDDEGKIDKEVYLPSIMIDPNSNIIYYISGWNQSKLEGDAKSYDGKETTDIADDVHQFGFQNDGSIIYISDYSEKKQSGDLMLFRGNKEPKLIDEKVSYILPMIKMLKLNQ